MNTSKKYLHFVIYNHENKFRLNLHHLVCMMSQVLTYWDYEVLIHCNDSKIERVIPILHETRRKLYSDPKDAPLVEVVKYDDTPAKEFYPTHFADYMRIKILNKYGGIYSDLDSLAVRYKDFYEVPFNKRIVACVENCCDDLCNGFFFAREDNEILNKWIKSYDSYQMGEVSFGEPSWTTYSTQMFKKLWNENPDDFVILPPSTFQPFYIDYKGMQDLFLLDWESDLEELPSQWYQIHLWESRHPRLFGYMGTEYLLKSNSLYAQIARRYLGSDPGYTMSEFNNIIKYYNEH